MSNNQETLIKETSELLELAQKEVLKEINSQKNLFSRLFVGDKKDNLKQAQSAISKAINQMKGLTKDHSTVISKLQSHLNEKANQVKKFEEDSHSREKEVSELRDRIQYYKAEFDRLQTDIKNKESKETDNSSSTGTASQFDSEEFVQRIKELEYKTKEFENKFKASQEDLEKSQVLSVELSKRLKRIKSEIVN